MPTGHWSEPMYTLWWRDAGTGRARVSFGENPDALLRRLASIWHPGLDPALYDPRGKRVALADEVTESDEHDQTAPAAPPIAPSAPATVVETVTVPVAPAPPAQPVKLAVDGRSLTVTPAQAPRPKKQRAPKAAVSPATQPAVPPAPAA